MVASANRQRGEVFLDARGNDRALRLTWHHECDLVVLSLWKDGTCAGTFRLSRHDVVAFVGALLDGLRDEPDSQAGRHGAFAEQMFHAPTGAAAS